MSQNWCSFSPDAVVTLSIGIPMKCIYSVVHYLPNKYQWTSVSQTDLELQLVLWKQLRVPLQKTRLSVSGHGRLMWIHFQLQWKMRFRKGGRYRRSEVEGAPRYSSNFVRCGVDVIYHSVGVEVICHSTFQSGYRF